MHVCMCVYVCTYVCMYVLCMYVCTYVPTNPTESSDRCILRPGMGTQWVTAGMKLAFHFIKKIINMAKETIKWPMQSNHESLLSFLPNKDT